MMFQPNPTAVPLPPGPRPRYPGQFMIALRRDMLRFLTDVADTYGDIASFPIGRRLRYVLVTHPELVREVLVTQDANFTKGPALRKARATLGDGLLTSEGDLHRRQRRLMQPAFHPHGVANYIPMMVGHARRTAERWQDGMTVDMHAEMMRLTLLIVAETLFGGDVEPLVDDIGRAMTISVEMFNRALLPFGELLARLPLPSNWRFHRAIRLLDDTIDGFIRERRAAGSDRMDLLSILLRARDEGDGAGMSDQQLRDEAITLFTAGHETTANALTFTWHLLAQNHEAEARLHEELDRVLGDRAPEQSDLPNLTWTRAVLAESMRLYPPAWAMGRQAIGECQVGGYRVPAGAVVLMSPWVTHRSARYWPNPLAFQPQRWLGEWNQNRPRYAYYPFGGGSRGCIGEAFAWTEATCVLATLARPFRAERADVSPLRLNPTITLRPRGGVKMTLVGRT